MVKIITVLLMLIAIIFEAHAEDKTAENSDEPTRENPFNFIREGKGAPAKEDKNILNEDIDEFLLSKSNENKPDGHNISMAVCNKGKVIGTRTEFTPEKGFRSIEDSAYLDNLVYIFSKPHAYVLGEEEGLVSIHYGDRQTQGAMKHSVIAVR